MRAFKRGKDTWYVFKAKDFYLLEQELYNQEFRKRVFYETNKKVVINNHSEDDVKLFHAGTKIQNNQLMTSGGRVFCATGIGTDLANAQKNAYNLVSKISFDGAFNRKDIGNKGIN